MACLFFFFIDTATTEIYTLSLHDALPILRHQCASDCDPLRLPAGKLARPGTRLVRSEEHTSELQSHSDLVCRLLLEKKKKKETTKRRHCKHAHAEREYTGRSHDKVCCIAI